MKRMRFFHAVAGSILCLTLFLGAVPPPNATAGPTPKKPKKPKKPSCSVDGQITNRGKGWTSIKLPHPANKPKPSQGQNMIKETTPPRHWAVDPVDPKRMFVANDSTVMRSKDGGCTWKDAWQVPVAPDSDAPFSHLTTSIESIEIAETGHDNVYLVLREGGFFWGYNRVGVVRSQDGGDTWAASGGWLPTSDHVFATLRIAPRDPKRLYLLASMGAMRAFGFYSSEDGGDSWSLESIEPCTPSPCNDWIDFVIDPLDSRKLWMWNRNNPPRRSNDGGKTWEEASLPPKLTPSTLDIWHEEGAPAQIVINSAGILRSRDDGNSWAPLGTPGELRGIVDLKYGPSSPDSIVALVSKRDHPTHQSPSAGIYRVDPRAYRAGRSPWVDITPPGLDDISVSSLAWPGLRISTTSTTKGVLHFGFLDAAGEREPTIERYTGRF